MLEEVEGVGRRNTGPEDASVQLTRTSVEDGNRHEKFVVNLKVN